MGDMLEYFQRVVALDPDTFFSIHSKSPTGGMPGIACQDYQEAINYADRLKSQFDVYLAMGAQVACENDGAAIRKTENTCAARCLYMDIDVKQGAYASTAEAAKACNEFIHKTKLPTPTVIVKSGTGGLHVYWTLNELITLDEFKKLSSQLSSAARQAGLLFDRNCTTDITRLLRVPGTLNFKTNPPSPVELVHAGDEVDINVIRAVLAKFPVVLITPKSNKVTVNADLGSGPKQYRHPTIEQVAGFCPFIAETLELGGTNLADEPQWHDMMAVACHCVDPSPTAHRLCEKNQYYNRDDTEKKLQVALNYRQQNSSLGPPGCVTLHDNGAKQCDTCPHLDLGTSPVALPFRELNGHAYFDDLPPSYFRDGNGRICVEEIMDNGKPKKVIIFPYEIVPRSGYMENSYPYQLTFETRQGESLVQKTFPASMCADVPGFQRAILNEGISIPNKKLASKAQEFFMHYIQLLASRKRTMITMPPLGWTKQDDVMGFAYDGEFVTPQGKYPCRHLDKGVANYRVTGDDKKVWRDMAQMVLTPDRPDLQVLAATAFSAPLVKMSGQNGYLIGAWSAASGIGKTTALMLSQSVWAPPVLGGFSDTVNYTFAKCASVQHLPVIFDEVKGELQTDNFVRLVFELTGGHEKGRADRKGDMRESRTWNTNIAYASNTSIVAATAEQTKGTHAGVYRMFEFQAINRPNVNLTSDMADLTTQLRDNYGHIGKIYANYLGEHYFSLRARLLKFQAKIEKDLSAQSSERCWVAAMSTTLFGAALAKSLGLAPFDIPVMREFMTKEFFRMRSEQSNSSSDYTNPDVIYHELNTLVNEKNRHLIITDRAWGKPGRPVKNYAKVLNDRVLWDEIGIQISGDPLTLRIKDTFLGKWCKEHKKPKAALVEAIKRVTKADRRMSCLASGTGRAQHDEWTWVILMTGTPLEDMGEYAVQRGLLK